MAGATTRDIDAGPNKTPNKKGDPDDCGPVQTGKGRNKGSGARVMGGGSQGQVRNSAHGRWK